MQALNNTDEDFIGETIADRYHCLEKLGVGGMGIVYLAEDILLKRKVVVKVLKQSDRYEHHIKRFLREAELLSQLSNPHIVTIHDFGTWRKVTYIIMEFLDGEDLKQVIKAEAPMAVDRIMNILNQMMIALEAAHKTGIIHRDLKPANIFCLKTAPGEDFIKVLDFGLAISMFQDEKEKITKSGEMLGTPHYMSPETIMTASELTMASDFYSLGVILYEMISGDVPYQGTNTMEIFLGHLYKSATPLNIDQLSDDPAQQKLEEVINICMRKNPVERYQSIDEMRKDLTTKPKQSVRLPENLMDDRQERYKQFFSHSITEIFEGRKELTSLQGFSFTVLEEDTVPVEESLAPMLHTMQYDVEIYSYQDWLELENQQPLDLLILNCHLKTNLTLIEEIRTKAGHERVPVLICGPQDDLDYISQTIEVGANDYLSFPFDPMDVLKKLYRALQRRR